MYSSILLVQNRTHRVSLKFFYINIVRGLYFSAEQNTYQKKKNEVKYLVTRRFVDRIFKKAQFLSQVFELH